MSAGKKLLREAFRNIVFRRDGYRCRTCGCAAVKLDAHHITDRNLLPAGGYVKENGITLCDTPGGCHEKAERFHQNLEVPEGYMPDDLYRLIGSSLEAAEKASERLARS